MAVYGRGCHAGAGRPYTVGRGERGGDAGGEPAAVVPEATPLACAARTHGASSPSPPLSLSLSSTSAAARRPDAVGAGCGAERRPPVAVTYDSSPVSGQRCVRHSGRRQSSDMADAAAAADSVSTPTGVHTTVAAGSPTAAAVEGVTRSVRRRDGSPARQLAGGAGARGVSADASAAGEVTASARHASWCAVRGTWWRSRMRCAKCSTRAMGRSKSPRCGAAAAGAGGGGGAVADAATGVRHAASTPAPDTVATPAAPVRSAASSTALSWSTTLSGGTTVVADVSPHDTRMRTAGSAPVASTPSAGAPQEGPRADGARYTRRGGAKVCSRFRPPSLPSTRAASGPCGLGDARMSAASSVMRSPSRCGVVAMTPYRKEGVRFSTQ